MNIFQKLIALLTAVETNDTSKKPADLMLYSLTDYQESNLENYLSGCCLSNIY